jgi:hypothetical protein
MAVGTVSGLNLDEEWQLITTNTPSAAASTTFSSISGYKKLMLVFKSYTTSVASGARMSFNGDTTNGNYSSNADWGVSGLDNGMAFIHLGGYPYSTQDRTGYAIIESVNKSIPHLVYGSSFDAITLGGIYIDPNPITSVTITGAGGTITGTFYLYGIAA